MHGVLYNICKISTKLNMQCILFTLASESSCIHYLLHILHILNMLQKHFFVKMYWLRFISSVRSSYSHPDLLLIHHHPPPHFFRTHQSSILDFHFLSHYSYIKGNHWTHLLATCIPYGYNGTSLQDSARLCKIVQDGTRWCNMV